jgi:hypothetical protein
LRNGESETFANLDPGTYTVTEQDVASWSIRSIDCIDPSGNSAGGPSTGVTTIDLDAGESVRCTYVNHFARIPDTGSDSTRPLIALGIGLVVRGAAFWVFGAARRRHRPV